MWRMLLVLRNLAWWLVQWFEPDRGGSQQAQRIDIVGARRRTPHGAPVQTRRGPAAGVPGHQLADHGLGGHQLTGPDGRPYRLVAGVQTAGVSQRHHGPSRQQPGEHHCRAARGIHLLTRGAGQVYTSVPGIPIRRRGVESPHDCRGRPQRPIQPIVVGKRRCCADQHPAQEQRYPPHPVSSALRRRRGQPCRPALWTTVSLWTRAGENHQLGRCKLLVAAR